MNQTNQIKQSETWRLFAAALLISALMVVVLGSFYFSAQQIIMLLILLSVAGFAILAPTGAIILALTYITIEVFFLRFVPDFSIAFLRLIPEVVIYSLFAAAGVKLSLSRYENKNLLSDSYLSLTEKIKAPGGIIILIFAIISAASILVNFLEPTVAILGLRQIFRFILLYLAIVWLNLKTEKLFKILIVFFALVVAQSIIALLQSLIGAPADAFLAGVSAQKEGGIQIVYDIWQQRVAGTSVFATMGRYDQLGVFLSLGAAAALGFLYSSNAKFQRYAILGFIFILPALVLTYSRASWFAFLAALILVGLIIQRDKKILFALLILVITVGGYTAIKEIEVRRLIAQPEFTPTQRLLETFSTARIKSEYTGKGRTYFIVETPPAIIKNAPFLGVGPGMFGGGAVVLLRNTEAYDRLNLPFGIYGTEGQIDNNWISILAETGFVGVLFYLTILIALFKFAYQNLKRKLSDIGRALALGLMGATLAYAVLGMFGLYFEVRTSGFTFWLFAGLAVSYLLQEIKSPKHEDPTHQ